MKKQRLSKPASTQEALERMRQYKRRADRSPPPVFGGRREQLDWLSERMIAVQEGALGMTSVVYGVPGMGKTALGQTFADQLERGGQAGTNGPCAFCAKVTPDALDTAPIELMHEITRSLASSGWGKMGAVRERLEKMGDIALLLKYDKAGQELFDRPKGLNVETPMQDCLRAYAQDLWGEDVTVVLIVDEMQNCPVTDRTRAIIGTLHGGEQAQVLPVCLGLPNTKAKLRAMGLSGLSDSAAMEVNCLAEQSARTVIDDTIVWLGMEQAARGAATAQAWENWRRRLADGIAERSCGFPQHITLGLMGACEAMLAAPEQDRMSEEVLETASRIHERKKNAYYGELVHGDETESHALALAALALRIEQTGDMSNDEAQGFLAMAQDMDMGRSAALLSEAQRKGIVGAFEDPDEGPLCLPPPIPTMSGYLRKRFASALRRGHLGARKVNDEYGLLEQAT